MKVLSTCQGCNKVFWSPPPGLALCSRPTCTAVGQKRPFMPTEVVEPFVYEVDGDKDSENEEEEKEEDAAESEDDSEKSIFTCLICNQTLEMADQEEREAHLEACTRDFEFKSIELSQVMSGRTQMSQEIVQEAEESRQQQIEHESEAELAGSKQQAGDRRIGSLLISSTDLHSPYDCQSSGI